VIGLRSEELKRAIDASPQAFPPEIVTLRTRGGGIQRDSFEAIVGDLIEALGLGEQLLSRRGQTQLRPEPEPAPKPAPQTADAGVASDASSPVPGTSTDRRYPR
jgi:hypothetical protein